MISGNFLRTEHLLTGKGDHFDIEWLNSNKVVIPPNEEWDYQRELRLEDVYIWEKICQPWQWGVFAAWDPYAEFYVLRHEVNHFRDLSKDDEMPIYEFEYYYGAGAQDRLIQRMKQLDILKYTKFNSTWVEPEKMWLYT
jgi:hypothetical protein